MGFAVRQYQQRLLDRFAKYVSRELPCVDIVPFEYSDLNLEGARIRLDNGLPVAVVCLPNERMYMNELMFVLPREPLVTGAVFRARTRLSDLYEEFKTEEMIRRELWDIITSCDTNGDDRVRRNRLDALRASLKGVDYFGFRGVTRSSSGNNSQRMYLYPTLEFYRPWSGHANLFGGVLPVEEELATFPRVDEEEIIFPSDAVSEAMRKYKGKRPRSRRKVDPGEVHVVFYRGPPQNRKFRPKTKKEYPVKASFATFEDGGFVPVHDTSESLEERIERKGFIEPCDVFRVA